MKISKIALAAALVLGAITTAQAADALNGEVRFTGAIVDAPCSIDQNYADQSIPLGSISNVALAGGGSSAQKPFEIRLANCSLTTARTVTTTFSGDAGVGGLLGITGAGGAGIQLTDSNGATIQLGAATTAQTIAIGATDATLSFNAYLKGNGGGIDTIIPGQFTSVASFLLTYN